MIYCTPARHRVFDIRWPSCQAVTVWAAQILRLNIHLFFFPHQLLEPIVALRPNRFPWQILLQCDNKCRSGQLVPLILCCFIVTKTAFSSVPRTVPSTYWLNLPNSEQVYCNKWDGYRTSRHSIHRFYENIDYLLREQYSQPWLTGVSLVCLSCNQKPHFTRRASGWALCHIWSVPPKVGCHPALPAALWHLFLAQVI